MAVVERTIKKDGTGDYTSIAAWEAAAPALGTDIWKGVISDNNAYDEAVTISVSGTPSATSYVWLTVAEANRHSGVAGTGHARMTLTGATSGNAITIATAYTRVSHLEIYQFSPGISDEAIRINAGGDNTLIHDCILWTDHTNDDTDGIYTGNWSVGPIFVDHCIIYGWQRAGIHPQQYSTGGAGYTQTWYVDYCSIYKCESNTEVESGAIHVRSSHSGDNITVNVYNTWGISEIGKPEFTASDGASPTPVGTVTWNGDRIAHQIGSIPGGLQLFGGTNNVTNVTQVTNITTVSQASGTYVVVNSITAPVNLLLLDDAAGNFPVGTGTDRTGSEPDARQDFSTDILGNTRSTASPYDIGAHEFGATVGGGSYTGSIAQTLPSIGQSATGTVPAFGTPTGLAAAVVSQTQIDLSWNAVFDADGYDVERDSVIIAQDVLTNAYSDTGLTAATEYTYRVRATRFAAAWVPDDLSNLFALYDADRVSDQVVAEDNDTTALTGSSIADSGHTWSAAGPSNFDNWFDSGLADLVVEGTLYSVGAGLAFRGNNTTFLHVYATGTGKLQLYKESSLLVDAGFIVNDGLPHIVRISAHSDRIKVWLDATDPKTEDPVIDYVMTSADYTALGGLTYVGYYNYGNLKPNLQVGEGIKVSTLDQVADHTVAFDSFTRADGDLNGTTTEVGGLTWESDTLWDILSNKVHRNSASGGSFAVFDSLIADGVISVDLDYTATDSYGGIAFRSNGNYQTQLGLRFNVNGDLDLWKNDGGSATILASATYGLVDATTYNFKVVFVGDRILCFVDGVLQIDHTLSSADQTTYGALTHHGLYANSAPNSFWDNYRFRRLTRVPVWPDVSRTGTDRVNANHAKQTTEAAQPILVEDWHGVGKATTLFDGVDDRLKTSPFTSPLAQPVTYHAVHAIPTAQGLSKDLYDSDTTADRILVRINANNYTYYSNGEAIQDTGKSVTGNAQTMIFVAEAPTASVFRVDGVDYATGGPIGSRSLPELTMGYGAAGSGAATAVEISTFAIENAATTQAADFEQWATDRYADLRVEGAGRPFVQDRQTAVTANGGDVTVSFTASEGDTVVVCSGVIQRAGHVPTPSTNGYTSILSLDADGYRFDVSTKTMGATPDGSVTVSGTGNSADAMIVAVAVVSDAVTASTVSSVATPDGAGEYAMPTISVTDHAVVLAYSAFNDNNSATTDPLALSLPWSTNIIQDDANDTNPLTIGWSYDETHDAQTVNPGTWDAVNLLGDAVNIVIALEGS